MSSIRIHTFDKSDACSLGVFKNYLRDYELYKKFTFEIFTERKSSNKFWIFKLDIISESEGSNELRKYLSRWKGCQKAVLVREDGNDQFGMEETDNKMPIFENGSDSDEPKITVENDDPPGLNSESDDDDGMPLLESDSDDQHSDVDTKNVDDDDEPPPLIDDSDSADISSEGEDSDEVPELVDENQEEEFVDFWKKNPNNKKKLRNNEFFDGNFNPYYPKKTKKKTVKRKKTKKEIEEDEKKRRMQNLDYKRGKEELKKRKVQRKYRKVKQAKKEKSKVAPISVVESKTEKKLTEEEKLEQVIGKCVPKRCMQEDLSPNRIVRLKHKWGIVECTEKCRIILHFDCWKKWLKAEKDVVTKYVKCPTHDCVGFCSKITHNTGRETKTTNSLRIPGVEYYQQKKQTEREKIERKIKAKKRVVISKKEKKRLKRLQRKSKRKSKIEEIEDDDIDELSNMSYQPTDATSIPESDISNESDLSSKKKKKKRVRKKVERIVIASYGDPNDEWKRNLRNRNNNGIGNINNNEEMIEINEKPRKKKEESIFSNINVTYIGKDKSKKRKKKKKKREEKREEEKQKKMIFTAIIHRDESGWINGFNYVKGEGKVLKSGESSGDNLATIDFTEHEITNLPKKFRNKIEPGDEVQFDVALASTEGGENRLYNIPKLYATQIRFKNPERIKSRDENEVLMKRAKSKKIDDVFGKPENPEKLKIEEMRKKLKKKKNERLSEKNAIQDPTPLDITNIRSDMKPSKKKIKLRENVIEQNVLPAIKEFLSYEIGQNKFHVFCGIVKRVGESKGVVRISEELSVCDPCIIDISFQCSNSFRNLEVGDTVEFNIQKRSKRSKKNSKERKWGFRAVNLKKMEFEDHDLNQELEELEQGLLF